MHRSIGTAVVSAMFLTGITGVAAAGAHLATHRVAPGETIAAIAAAEHVSVDDLARINRLAGGSSLPAGTMLALDAAAVRVLAEREVSPAPAAAQVPAGGLDTTSDMPEANADLKMWSAGAPAPAALLEPDKKLDPIHRFARGIISRTSTIALSLTRSAMRFIGTPYVFGGTTSAGFDCSGYVQHVFAMLGIQLPRTADAQYYAGHPPVGGVRTGDLVFFQTYLPGPSHVGIYLGDGRFIHSSSHGVMISRLADSYWASRYLGAKRFVALR